MIIRAMGGIVAWDTMSTLSTKAQITDRWCVGKPALAWKVQPRECGNQGLDDGVEGERNPHWPRSGSEKVDSKMSHYGTENCPR